MAKIGEKLWKNRLYFIGKTGPGSMYSSYERDVFRY
jgi:hypothetical protein